MSCNRKTHAPGRSILGLFTTTRILAFLVIFAVICIAAYIKTTSLSLQRRQRSRFHLKGSSLAVSRQAMDHSSMDHSQMDHSKMNHSGHGDMMDSGKVMDNGYVDHSTMNHGSMDHMMKMYFHFGVTETILFNFWKTASWQGMLGSCVAVFVMASLYEGLKVGREMLLRRAMVTNSYTVAVPTTDEAQAMTGETRKQLVARARILSCSHFLQTLLHILQIVTSYFLMLIFMTYNVWLCIAVAAGAGVGYFAFSWKRAVIVDVNEHCH